MRTINHAELIERAGRWLYNTRRCDPVYCEPVGNCEIADAIGWRMHFSIIVECKVSVGDFYSDRSKGSWGATMGMGRQRFYLTPRQVIKPHLVPEWWGLLEVHGKIIRVIKDAPLRREYQWHREVQLLARCAAGRREHNRWLPPPADAPADAPDDGPKGKR